MSATSVRLGRLPGPITPMIAIGCAALLALIVTGIFLPQAVLQGWLAAFVFWSGIAFGALVLGLIHRLTGGRWGDALAPVLTPLTAMLPLALLAFVPIALGLREIFPWVTHTAEPASLARYYLNPLSFLLRAGVVLIGLGGLAVLLVAGRCSRLLAGLGLAFYALIIDPIAVDWILSLHPGFGSSAFGMEIAVQQMLSALAFAAVIGPERSAATADDLGGLLIATLLGLFYLGLMGFVVAWYGDLPAKAEWFLARSQPAWVTVMTLIVVVGFVAPLGLLLLRRVRDSRNWLRLVGVLILVGVALHVAWLIGPALAPRSLAAMAVAVIALVAISCLSAAFTPTLVVAMRRKANHA